MELSAMEIVMSKDQNEPNFVSSHSELVRGEIVFNPIPSPEEYDRMVIRIYFEDVSYADAPAMVITSLVIDRISSEVRARNRVPFVIEGPFTNSKARYSLRVHVALDGNAKICKGDYINTINYPVLTYGHPAQVEVQVSAVE